MTCRPTLTERGLIRCLQRRNRTAERVAFELVQGGGFNENSLKQTAKATRFTTSGKMFYTLALGRLGRWQTGRQVTGDTRG